MQDKVFRTKTTLNLGGKLFNIDSPLIMGILNLTPDSFYDGGKHQTSNQILLQVEKMLQEGAHIIDVGAYSSRPGALHIDASEEWKRLEKVLKAITHQFPEAIVSVDTFRASIAEKAVQEGATIINDISGGTMDINMFKTIAKLQVPYVLMHMQGTPQTMQNNPTYNDLLEDIIFDLSQKVDALQQAGVHDIIVDPGLGFGKTIEDNYSILKHIHRSQLLGYPVLIGVSRKSMIYKVLENTPQEALNGTTAAHTIALLNGANILRAHDVKAAQEAIKIVHQYKIS